MERTDTVRAHHFLPDNCLTLVALRSDFSWQWHSMVMATTVTSSLVHLFPYNNSSQALKIVALIVFFVALSIFVFDMVCNTYSRKCRDAVHETTRYKRHDLSEAFVRVQRWFNRVSYKIVSPITLRYWWGCHHYS